MAAAKIRKAIIRTRYPTARDLADFLHVPQGFVERLATELMESQRNGGRAGLSASRHAARKSVTDASGRRTTNKRAGRAR